MLAPEPKPVELERIESIQQDIKFVNSLLSQSGLEAPFPFSRAIADPVTPSDLYHLETATRILISLLNCKQVPRRRDFDFALLITMPLGRVEGDGLSHRTRGAAAEAERGAGLARNCHCKGRKAMPGVSTSSTP